MPSKGDVEFTALAMRDQLVSKEKVDECLKYQDEIEKDGRQTTVDRIMLQKGYLSEAQVFELNKKQGRRVVFCTKCAMKMNVAGLAVGQKIKCPKCQTSNVTPEKIAFELVEKSKPVGEVLPAAPVPIDLLPDPPAPPIRMQDTASPKPTPGGTPPKPPPPTVRMELSAGQKSELNFAPAPLAPVAAAPPAGEEKASDSPKINDIRAEGKGKKFAMRKYGKR
jgi:hypothetical protein